jgi:hypothetical protein
MVAPAPLEEIVGVPWERQPRERDRAYYAFQCYRDIGPVHRSIRDLAAQLGMSQTQVAGWSSSFRWVERCRAFDEEQERANRRALDESREQMVKRHAAVSTQVLQRITQRLLGDEANGISPLDISLITFADVVRGLDTAVKIERLSRGIPNEVRGHVGMEGGPPIRHELSAAGDGQPAASGDDLIEFLQGLEDAGIVPHGTGEHARSALAGEDPNAEPVDDDTLEDLGPIEAP